MNAPIAEFALVTAANPAEMRKVLRRLIAESGMSRRKIDEIAGLPIGYTDKLLCEPPLRNIGPTSLFPLIWAIAHRIAFIPDPEARKKIEKHHMFLTRDERKARGDDHWRNAKVLAETDKRMKNAAISRGKARFAKMTPLECKRHQRKAANARWRAFRRRKRLALESANRNEGPASGSIPKRPASNR